MNLIDLLSYTFFQNALIGSLLVSILCGIVGTYVVVRRLVFISGGITHASLGGVGIGFYYDLNPIFSAFIFSLLSAFGIEWLSSRQGVREDSAIGVLWSLGMAIGIIFIYLKSGYSPNLSDYLFGNILTITYQDLIYLAILSVIVILFFAFFRKQIIYSAFDPDFAQTRNLPVIFIKYFMIMLIAATIVFSLRLVGIVLLISILTIPPMTANLLSSNFNKIIFISIVLGFVGCLMGLLFSVILNVPSGVFIIFSQIIIFLFVKSFVFIKCKFKY